MPSLLTLAAPVALLLPLLGQSSAVVAGARQSQGAPVASAPDYEQPPESVTERSENSEVGINPLDAFYASQNTYQVRIEQRMTIRISPRRNTNNNRNELLAELPANGLRTTFEEREMSRCVPVAGIAAVQTGQGNRLLLFLRDERIVTINLERACRARDFYSGFYVERNEDGQLCVARDLLQSRSGVKCEIERMRQLVAVEE
ncbi:MAG: hypothetical protein AAF697_02330 [Pseudomonadota bacterium]